MGYQVRFGILEAGAYGVSQSRKHAFIWAASLEETPPEWPEPMHVFASPELKISLNGENHFTTVRSTSTGAPFHAITVRDTIGDLPAVKNGASTTTMEYNDEPVSWLQKKIRGDTLALTDHISKEMNELNLIRCQRIPRRPGADWRDPPDQKVYYSEQIVTVPLLAIEGKCEVRRKLDLPFMDAPVIFQHIFFCKYFYDHNNGAIKQLSARIKLTPSKERVVGDATFRKKGKCKGDTDFDEQKDASSSSCLATLGIFAGCGGLSEGLQKSGVSLTKWAIEY